VHTYLLNKHDDVEYAASFDNRGFDVILEHIARGLINPICTKTNKFDVTEFASDLL
jgi:hypothetical protein